MKTKSQYRRLPGRSGLLVRNSLWMGPDHVLRLRRNPFSESYRRYYFRDIQAIVLTELSNTGAHYGYTVAGMLALTTGVLFYARHPVWATLCALLALSVFFVSWRWPTSASYVKTSVSTEKLPSLGRLRAAKKTVAILKAEIEKVQGIVSPDAALAEAPAMRAGAAVAPAPRLRHASGRTHWILFALMLVRGAVAAISFGWRAYPGAFGIVEEVLGMTILLVVIFAAVQQRGSDLALGVRRLVYGTLAWYLANGLAAFVIGIYVVTTIKTKSLTPAMFNNLAERRRYELVDVIGYLILGCTGLILMWRHQRTLHTPPLMTPGYSA